MSLSALHSRADRQSSDTIGPRSLWRAFLAGLASIALGITLIVQPGAGALAVIWLIASYAIAYGIVLIALSFRLRSFAHQMHARFA